MKRLLLIAALALPSTVEAQNCGTALVGVCSISNLNISISFSRVIQLQLSSATTSLTVPTPAHYDNGYAPTDGPTLSIATNANWTLAVSSSTTLWSASNTGTEPARANKPASDLRWSRNVNGPFANMSTTPATVHSGTRSSSVTIPIYYRTTYAWGLDTPGQYSIQVVFTLTAP